MTIPSEPEVAGRLRRALGTFQKGQGMLLTAHRKLQGLPQEEVDRFWLSVGARLEAHVRSAAVEVVAAFKAFSAVGLVAGTVDRHLVKDAQRYLVQVGR